MGKKQVHPERHPSYIAERNGKQSFSKIVLILGLFLFGCSNRGFSTTNPNSIDGSADMDIDPIVSAESSEGSSGDDLEDLWPDMEGEYDIESELNELDIVDSGNELENYFHTIPVPPIITIPEICVYTSLRNVNCRESDYVESTLIAILMQGMEAKLLFVNPPFSHAKFELVTGPQCWIALGLMQGPSDPVKMCQVSVVDAPPPKESSNANESDAPVCSLGLDKDSCIAAGGDWVGGAVGAPYCDC